jgi:hypothetical protein
MIVVRRKCTKKRAFRREMAGTGRLQVCIKQILKREST